MVHDRHQLAVRVIRIRKVPPAQQWNAHRTEIVANHLEGRRNPASYMPGIARIRVKTSP
jgi:hypothetical protein